MSVTCPNTGKISVKVTIGLDMKAYLMIPGSPTGNNDVDCLNKDAVICANHSWSVSIYNILTWTDCTGTHTLSRSYPAENELSLSNWIEPFTVSGGSPNFYSDNPNIKLNPGDKVLKDSKLIWGGRVLGASSTPCY